MRGRQGGDAWGEGKIEGEGLTLGSLAGEVKEACLESGHGEDDLAGCREGSRGGARVSREKDAPRFNVQA